MQPAFLADHNIEDVIVESILRAEPSVRFFRVRELGLHRASDEAILDYAAANSLIVLTHDVNTMIGFAYDRERSGKPFAGLFVIRRSREVARIVDDLLAVWGASEAEEWQGRVVYLPFSR